MTYTAVMAAVLIGSFALMFGLVKFSEAIITRHEPVESETDTK